MKQFLAIFLITLVYTGTLAQKKNQVSGDREVIAYDQGKALYDKAKYTEAIPFFEETLGINGSNEDALYYSGLSYRYSGENEKALKSFYKLNEVNSNYWAWFYYEAGIAHMNLSQHTEAVSMFEKFLSKFPRTPGYELYHHQAKYKIQYASQQKELSAMPNAMKDAVKLSNGVNSDYLDAFPYLNPTGTKLYFSSKRLGGITKEDASAKEGDDDLYYTTRSGATWSDPQLLPEPINSPNNEGAPCFSGDGQIMVYTACNRDEGIGSCDLYISTLEGNEWTKPVNMGNVVNHKEWDSQPTISSDGNKVLFTSERPGGYGGYDLFMVEKNLLGDWGPATNLGGVVNTPFNETSPFISQDGRTLYFASDGHPGYGQSDLFKTVFENGKWSAPLNLGKPLNTSGADNYFTIGGSGEKGYFSSNRGGNTDIYEIEIPEEMRPQPTVVVSGTVTNAKTGKPVGAYVMVEDITTGELIAVNKSNSATGKYLVVLPSGRLYSVSANKESFFFHSERFDVPISAKFQEIIKDIALKPIEKGAKVVLNNIFFETGKATLSSESRVELGKAIDLMKANPSMIIEVGGHTDNVGDDAFNMKLSHDRAKSVRDYLVAGGIASARVQAKGYGESNPIASNDRDDGNKANRRTEFVILEF